MLRWKTFALSGIVLVSYGLGCSRDTGESSQTLTAFDRLGLLENLTENVVGPRYESFQEQTRVLQLAIGQACDGLAAGAAWADVRVPAQTQWQTTMDLWQEIEAFPFGPLAASAGELRYDIYVWPLFNSCQLDRQVGLLAQNPEAFLLSETDQVKSLSAIEYLLFAPDSLHSCRSTPAELNGWNERPSRERETLRCQYLRLLGEDIVSRSRELAQAWGSYQTQLVSPADQTVLQRRVNEVSDSLFYLTETVKDEKLARPLGLLACPSTVCPDRIEHPFADSGLSALEANLLGFSAIFSGGSEQALGFDDYLRAAGAPQLADQIRADTQQAIELTQDLQGQGTLGEQVSRLNSESCKLSLVEGSLEPLCALYREIKAITDELKSEFAQILQLQIPAQSSGDND